MTVQTAPDGGLTAHGRDLPPIDVDSMLVHFRRAVERDPDRVAVHYLEHDLTWGRLDADSDALAVALQEWGLARGDRVAVQLQNSPQFILALLAAWKVGAALVPVSPMYRADEIHKYLTKSAARVFVTEPALWERDGRQAVADTAVERAVTTDLADWGPSPTEAAAPDDAGIPVVDLLHLVREHSGRRPEQVDPAPDDLALLVFTSGTTGESKAAVARHRNVLSGTHSWTGAVSVDGPDEVLLSFAPFVHITGIVANVCALFQSGARLVLMSRFAPDAALGLIERYGVTWTVGASTAFTALLNARRADESADVSTLRTVLCGGAPVPTVMVGEMEERFGCRFLPGYGMTETCAAATASVPEEDFAMDPESGVVSVGRPDPGVAVRILDEDGNVAPARVQGEVIIQGDNVVDGYLDNPEETAKAFQDGWLRTGDVGFFDDGGHLFLVDRTKNMIIASGYKVWPREVEEILYRHPTVNEAAVVGIPDDYRGETVLAVVSARAGQEIVAEDLIAYCKEHLAAYKIPKMVQVVADVPKNPAGKVLHHEARASYLEATRDETDPA